MTLLARAALFEKLAQMSSQPGPNYSLQPPNAPYVAPKGTQPYDMNAPPYAPKPATPAAPTGQSNVQHGSDSMEQEQTLTLGAVNEIKRALKQFNEFTPPLNNPDNVKALSSSGRQAVSYIKKVMQGLDSRYTRMKRTYDTMTVNPAQRAQAQSFHQKNLAPIEDIKSNPFVMQIMSSEMPSTQLMTAMQNAAHPPGSSGTGPALGPGSGISNLQLK